MNQSCCATSARRARRRKTKSRSTATRRQACVQRPRSVPDAPGRLEDDFQLAPLLVVAEIITRHARSETALRAQRELVDVDEAAGLLDAALQGVHRLDLAGLGRDQAQHDDRRLAERALGHEAQWLEAAGAGGVVLQQE